MVKHPVVVYHANCCDGFCAAWLFHKVFPEAEFHAAQYGTEPPEVANDKDRSLYIGASVFDVPGVPSCAATLVLVVDEDSKLVKEIVSAPDDI